MFSLFWRVSFLLYLHCLSVFASHIPSVVCTLYCILCTYSFIKSQLWYYSEYDGPSNAAYAEDQYADVHYLGECTTPT